MNRNLLPFCVAGLIGLGTAASMSGQSKINIAGMTMLEEWRRSEFRIDHQARSRGGEVPTVSVMITLADDADASQIEAEGLTIQAARGNRVIVSMPIDRVEAFAAKEIVKRLSFGDKARPMLDKAREATSTNQVQTGADGLPSGYDGTGVITSLFDTGLQPGHVNFKDASGKTRVKGIWEVTGTDGSLKEYLTDQEIAGFTTENRNETHGTHVLGIMSGSYNGAGEYAGTVKTTTGDVPYYGVATGSDILVGCGDLYDNDILIGVDKMLKYAESEGKPLVVNLSLGSNLGPHDGSDDFNQMLAEYGKDAIICVAAGNEGDSPIAVSRSFSAMSTTLKTFIQPSAQTNQFSGVEQFYYSDSEPFEFSLVLYSKLKGEIVYQLDVNESTNGKSVYLASSNLTNDSYNHSDYFDETWGNSSYIAVATMVDPSNNRYMAQIQHQLSTKDENALIIPGVVIKGKKGESVYGYANSSSNNYTAIFTNEGIQGWTAGTNNGSISDMACGSNIIVIGSFTTRDSWYVIGSEGRWSYNSSSKPGEISGFSSYGQLWDGRKLPTLCAPGSAIISSVSSYWMNAAGATDNAVAKVTNDGTDYYWAVMQGTSMATPFAAGVFATWLQADNSLTIDDVVKYAKASAKVDAGVTGSGNSTQWGAGKLDALNGMKMVLASSGIGTIEAEPDGDADDRALVVTSPSRGVLDILVAGATSTDATLYDLSGVAVATARAEGMNVSLDASSASAGIYVLRVVTPKATLTRKVKL